MKNWLKKINWNLFNLSAWLTLAAAYVLPLRRGGEGVYRAGIPISFITANDSHLSWSLLLSQAFYPVSFLVDIMIFYIVLYFIHKFVKRYTQKKEDKQR